MEETNPSELTKAPLPTSHKPLTFWKGVLYGLVIIGAQLIVGSIVVIAAMSSMGIEKVQSGSEEAMDTMMNWIIGIALPLSFLLAAVLVLRRRKLHPLALRWQSSDFLLLLIGLVMLLGYNYVVGELMIFLPGYEDMEADYKSMFDGINMTYLLIGGVFIGPICEEIIFRGVIEEGFIQTYGGVPAVFYSALIFGVIHFLPLQVINAFLAGILLGWIYWKTRSLWLVMLLHIINNYLAFKHMDWEASNVQEWLENDVLYGLSFPLVALLMFGGYWLFNSISNKRSAML